MTNMQSESVTATPQGSLSDDDLVALRCHVTDLHDIPQENQDRILVGFQHAYESARRVQMGLKDPMSR